MGEEALDTWSGSNTPVPDSLLLHWVLEPPYGYVLGIALWAAYLAVWYSTVYAAEILGLIPFSVSVVVAVGGLLVTSVVSASAICVTAWKVPYTRLREHFVRVSLFALLAPALLVVYFRPSPAVPSLNAAIEPLGLGVFVEHALLTTGVVGPALGCAFLLFALLVLVFRYRLERT